MLERQMSHYKATHTPYLPRSTNVRRTCILILIENFGILAFDCWVGRAAQSLSTHHSNETIADKKKTN